MLGEKQEIFNMEEFTKAYPQCSADLQKVQMKGNVHPLQVTDQVKEMVSVRLLAFPHNGNDKSLERTSNHYR